MAELVLDQNTKVVSSDITVLGDDANFEIIDEVLPSQIGLTRGGGFCRYLPEQQIGVRKIWPDASIEFESDIKLKSTRGHETEFQIGFVQTVIAQVRTALFRNGWKWQETLTGGVPCRDGAAAPFYKEPLTYSTDDRPLIGKTISKTLNIYDRPSFTFPSHIYPNVHSRDAGVTSEVSEALHELVFLVALVVRRTGEFGAITDYFLATVEWKLAALYRSPVGQPATTTGGYIAFTPTDIPAARQQEIPDGLVLDGENANSFKAGQLLRRDFARLT